MKIAYCIDCNKQLSRNAAYYNCKRCKSCNSKIRVGILGRNYKSGLPKCLNCKKELKNRKAKYCRNCMGNNISNKLKERFKNPEIHPCWRGGISKLPYGFEFTLSLKEKIRKRDEYKCQNCQMTEEEHLIVKGRVLPIHHIDYDKTNNKEENLITVCNQCNSRANFNRDYWKDFYTEKSRVILFRV